MMKAALLLLLAAPAWAQVTLTQEGAPTEPAKGGFVAEERKPISAEAQSTLDQINAYRARGATCGSRSFEPAPPLEWNEALQRAAEVHVRDMGQRNTVSHDGSDGSSVGQRITRQGYTWGGAGENAAAGRDSVSGTLAQWMASPGHCSNMMGKDFRDVAVAMVSLPGSTYRWYWIMVLARPMR